MTSTDLTAELREARRALMPGDAGRRLVVHRYVCLYLTVAVCDVDEIPRLMGTFEESGRGDGSLAARAVTDLCAALRIALATVGDGR